MDPDPRLLDRWARTAVKLVWKPPIEPDLELLTSRDLDERRFHCLAQRDPPQCAGHRK